MWSISTILGFLAIVCVIGGALSQLFFGSGIRREPEAKPRVIYYRRKPYLLSRVEFALYAALQPVARTQRLIVFPKVRLEDVIGVVPHVKNHHALRSALRSRHVDFVLCDAHYLRPMVALEIEDSSIETQEHNDIFDHAGLPLIRVPVQRMYDPEQLAHEIRRVLRAQHTGRRAEHGDTLIV